MTIMESYQLFSRVNEILARSKKSSDESSACGGKFNMFHVLGIDSYELSHSAVIAELLNPKGTHGQGNAFLKLFLETLPPQSGVTFNADDASVHKEFPCGEGRMDILITDREEKQAIIIENKIYAPDQPEQLQRYDTWAKGKYGNGNYLIIYLTLDGRDASEQSRGGINYILLSYRKDILSWVDRCIEYASAMPLIRGTLVQYSNLIKKLTHQNMEQKFSDELLTAMADNADAVAAITNAQDEFRKYAFERYVRPEFQKFAAELSLEYEECDLFNNCGDRGFYFCKNKWGNMAVWVYTEQKKSDADFYIGVSCKVSEKMPLHGQLKCLRNKGNEYWPFGWEWLEKYGTWNMDTVAQMVSGNFASFITSKVNEILEELKGYGY